MGTNIGDDRMAIMSCDKVLHAGAGGILQLIAADEVIGNLVLLCVRRSTIRDRNNAVSGAVGTVRAIRFGVPIGLSHRDGVYVWRGDMAVDSVSVWSSRMRISPTKC
jgi:hypothetical protein